MKYNNIIFLGLCLGLTTYSALSADSVIKISGRVLDYGCTVSSDSLNFTVDLQKNSARQFPTTGSTSPAVPFQITLSECSKGTTGVRVAFNGIEDAENNTLLKLDEGSNTASGLGIEILDAKAGKVFAFSCNVDGGSSIGAGTTSVYVNLDPVIQPGQNLVVDLSQHISCWNDYGGWYDTDHINLVQGSAFAGSLQSYKGSLYWNNVTYPFPLTTNTNVLDIGDKTPMPLPLKLYITPVGAAGGVVIKAGEVIARIHMYKIATLGSGNPRNFTWNIISNNNVVMPTGGCTVDSRNVTVDLPDFPGSAEIPLGVYCSSEQKLSFYLSGATTDSSRQVFANTAPDATKASGVGVTLMRNGKILATGENVSLGTVNKSKVPLGLSATYGQTGNKVSAGTVQSVIGVTFIYE
ncbi:fimbrial protein [Escherichia coli]|nr:fimbrial protein [Escherichia coli]MCS1095312.1 fimbrial protein [Escherichia coli]